MVPGVGVVGVVDAVVRVTWLEGQGVAHELADGGKLVAATLALGIEPDALRLLGGGTGTHAHGCYLRLQLSACPVGETHACAVTVGDNAQGEELIVGEHGLDVAQQVLAHVLVAAEAARGHDDGLAVVLLVFISLEILDDDTSYRARLVLYKLLGAAVEEELCTQVDGLLAVALVNHRLGDVAVHAEGGGVVVIAANFSDEVVVVALVDLGEAEVAGVVVLYRGVAGNLVVCAHIEVPVRVGTGVLGELHDEVGVDGPTSHHHPVGEVFVDVNLGCPDLEHIGSIDGGGFVAHGLEHVLVLLLKQNDRVTLLGNLAACGDACVTVTNDDDVGLACNGGIIDGLGLGAPSAYGRAVGADIAVFAGILGLCHKGRMDAFVSTLLTGGRGIFGLLLISKSTCGNACRCHGGCRHACACDEAPAVDVGAHESSLCTLAA